MTIPCFGLDNIRYASGWLSDMHTWGVRRSGNTLYSQIIKITQTTSNYAGTTSFEYGKRANPMQLFVDAVALGGTNFT
jgi:hypothetical protein